MSHKDTQTETLSLLLEKMDMKDFIKPMVEKSTFSSCLIESEHTDEFCKVGGLPYVSKDFIWPQNEGFPMQFFMQLRLSDFEDVENAYEYLPSKGYLYFFTDDRQNINSLDDAIESEEDIKKALEQYDQYPKEMLRTKKGKNFFVYFEPDEDIDLYDATTPKELKLKYPFFTYTMGFEEFPLIRDEQFVKPVTHISLPDDYIRSFCLDQKEIYYPLYEVRKFFEEKFPQSLVSLFEEGFISCEPGDWFDRVSLDPNIDGGFYITGLSEDTKQGDFSDLVMETDFEILD